MSLQQWPFGIEEQKELPCIRWGSGSKNLRCLACGVGTSKRRWVASYVGWDVFACPHCKKHTRIEGIILVIANELQPHHKVCLAKLGLSSKIVCPNCNQEYDTYKWEQCHNQGFIFRCPNPYCGYVKLSVKDILGNSDKLKVISLATEQYIKDTEQDKKDAFSLRKRNTRLSNENNRLKGQISVLEKELMDWHNFSSRMDELGVTIDDYREWLEICSNDARYQEQLSKLSETEQRVRKLEFKE